MGLFNTTNRPRVAIYKKSRCLVKTSGSSRQHRPVRRLRHATTYYSPSYESH